MRDILEVLALALALYIVIAFALQTVRVDGESMVPTLDNNDLLFADKLSYHLHSPNRGDIVVLIPPDDPSRDFIKRIIGVPGDIIEINGRWTDAQHPQPQTAILIKPDGQGPWQRVQESYLPEPWDELTYCCDENGRAVSAATPLTVPKDEYFVLGDNRNKSRDSRSIGLIPRQNIIGRALIRIWPLNRFGFFGQGPQLVSTGVLLPFPAWLLRRRRRRALRRLREQPPAA